MKRIVILGGGVSGLTAAFVARNVAREQGRQVSIALVESQQSCGGWFKSHRREEDGILFERGPHSFRPVGVNGMSCLKLVEELGIEDQALGTSKDAAKRYLYIGGKLHGMPTSLASMFTNELTRSLPIAGIREALFVAKHTGEDETIHSFFSRRFNEDIADTFACAMIAGIFAGDIRSLSIQSCLPVLSDLETKYGSVVRGLVQKSLLENAPVPSVDNGIDLSLQTNKCKDLSTRTGVSFKEGMEFLTNALEDSVFGSGDASVNLVKGTKVNGIGEDKTVHLDDGTVLEADAIISAVPLPALGAIVPNSIKDSFSPLIQSTRYADVGVVNIGYTDMPHLPYRGFGHLSPAKEKSGVLGMIYDSEVFPDQQPANTSCLTVMVGGTHAPQLARLGEDEMGEYALSKVSQQLGITVPPAGVAARGAISCIPQYSVGHKDLVADLFQAVDARLGFLNIIGNNFQGVGIADSIANARKAAHKVVNAL